MLTCRSYHVGRDSFVWLASACRGPPDFCKAAADVHRRVTGANPVQGHTMDDTDNLIRLTTIVETILLLAFIVTATLIIL